LRIKKGEEEEYNKRLDAALAIYKGFVERCEAPHSPAWFIDNFNLVKYGKKITSKRWYTTIDKTKGITSYSKAIKRRKIKVLNDMERGIPKKTIMSKHKISVCDLERLISKMQSPLLPKSLIHYETACSLYRQGYPIEYIEKRTGLCSHTVRKLLIQGEVSLRTQAETSIRYPDLRADYFKSIDSPEKAWVFGFIYADGSINQKNSLQVSQSLENDHILKIIADELNYPGKFSSAKKSHTKKRQSILTISRHEIYKDLLRLGMTTNKEMDLRFPFSKIKQQYYWAFLSGLYNGDGGLSLNIKENPRVKNGSPGLIIQLGWQITSTKEMCEDIAIFLQGQMPEIKIDVRQEGKKNAWKITVSSSRIHILTLVRELDKHAFGIQILDKYDKAVFFQRRNRRISAIKAVRSCKEANLLRILLTEKVEKLKRSGMALKDIAEFLETNRSSLRRMCQGLVFPSTNKVLSRFCRLFKVEENDFIDWSLLESLNFITPAWELKNPEYKYHRLQVGLFGEVIRV
jgi:hypothetical protein